MPLWEQPASLPEINALFAEGRATLDRRPVRDGLDFARAVAALGVNRGISAFERYAFLQRRGDAISATPKGRIRVQPRPKARLLSDLDAGDWLSRLRQYARKLDAQSKNFVAPRQLQTLALQLDEAIFAMTQDASPRAVQRVLAAVSEAASYLASSPKARDPKEGRQRPPPRLSRAWFEAAKDDSVEFRVAAALAGLGRAQRTEDHVANAGDETDVAAVSENDIVETVEREAGSDVAERHMSDEEERGPTPPPPLRAHLAPLKEETWYKRFRAWSDRDRLAVWGAGALERNLIAVAERRLVFAAQRKLDGGPFDGRAPADLSSVLSLLWRETDDEKVAGLARGLAWADAPNFIATKASPSGPLPLAYAVMKPFFAPIADVRAIEGVPQDIRLPVPPGLIARLRAGDVGAAMALACRRARASGLPISFEPRREDAAGIDGPRLLAALLIPICKVDLKRVLERAYPRLFESKETPHPKEDAADAA
jgi:CRISPR-associated protein Csx17